MDFGKLLPKDRVLDDEGKLEMFLKNGAYWMPANTAVSINSFTKWEQAFRVFSNIYCKANPHQAAELIEYNHVIYTISLAYTWENVYTYDREFRMHMARFPQRSWAMILPQAWSLRLRDRITNQGGSAGSSNFRNAGKQSEPCRRFNWGKCNFGAQCKYEHRCSYCFKFGHGVLTCRKAQGDRSTLTSSGKDKDFKRNSPFGKQIQMENTDKAKV